MSSASDFTRVCLQIRTTRERPCTGEISTGPRVSMGQTFAETDTDRNVSLCVFRGDKSGFLEVLKEGFSAPPVQRRVSALQEGNDAPSRLPASGHESLGTVCRGRETLGLLRL